jgi:hypothetical protein
VLHAVHSQLDASTASAHSNTPQAALDDDTAQRLATTTSYSVLGASYSEYARAAMLRAATDAGSAATAGAHSVVQPTMLAQPQQQQTAANAVDLARSESPHKTTVNKIPELVTPASCYGVRQLWAQQPVTTSSTTATNGAYSTGRRNAMVCDDQVVADFNTLSLAAKVSYSIHHRTKCSVFEQSVVMVYWFYNNTCMPLALAHWYIAYSVLHYLLFEQVDDHTRWLA